VALAERAFRFIGEQMTAPADREMAGLRHKLVRRERPHPASVDDYATSPPLCL